MQQTFTEAEFKTIAKAVNYIIDHAKWKNLSTREVVQTRNHIAALEQMAQKIKDHILEYGELRKLKNDSETA